jgi:tryptophan-rich sensory protein
VTWRTFVVIAVIAAVIAYAVLSGLWVSNSNSWYLSLNRPSFQPPNWIFGLIWPYNFVVLAVAGVQVMLRAEPMIAGLWMLLLIASVVAAIAWSYYFYVPHNLEIATYALSSAALFTLGILILTFMSQLVVGWFLLPYQIWLIIASALSYSYWQLN